MSPAKRIVEDSTAEELVSPAPGAPRVVERDDFVDVPATVVCALCGDPDCPGCAEERSRSGVISIVAWERGGPPLARLWSTAKASTQNAEGFFESLPDGPIMPALRFAVLAELVDSAAMLVGLGALFLLALLALGVAPSAASLVLAARVAFAGVIGLTVLLVAAHATHGYALDLGARAAGALRSPTRALRFGLYAAGWDLMLGPVGFFGLLLRDGPKAAFGLAGNAVGLPTRCSVSFLRGAYGIHADRARPALHASYVGAALATVVCALVILATIAFALLR
ncbi:MAG TPA: hypothetical protein VLM85_07870 [Polyangiaceae bacterium]|nr:hypothetical protein [Polyangiaceae bacterium]